MADSPEDKIETCSFCDKTRREVAKLVSAANTISGVQVFICDECIGLAVTLIAPVVKIPGAALQKLLAKTSKLDEFRDQIVDAVQADEQKLLARLEQTEGELSRIKHFLDHWHDHFSGNGTNPP